MEFYTYKNHKARKDHICDLCGSQIKRGEQYIRFSGKYDGELFDLKYHKACKSIIDEYCDYTGENEYDDDAVSSWLSEVICCDCIYGSDQNDDCVVLELQCDLIKQRFAKQREVDAK